MADLAKFTKDGKLTVPEEVAGRFRATDRFVVWADRDTVHFKRINPPNVTEIVAQGPDAEPMSPSEIAEEIRGYRREKKTA